MMNIVTLLAFGGMMSANALSIDQRSRQPSPRTLAQESGDSYPEPHMEEGVFAQTSIEAAQEIFKSEAWNQPIKVKFENTSDMAIKLNWHNYQGALVSYGTIEPRGTKSMYTFATHPWSAAGDGSFSVDGDDVWVPEAADNGRTIYIDETVDYRSLNADSGLIPLIFENESDVPAQIFWHDYAGELVSYATIAPGATYAQQTFATHPWSAEAAGDLHLNVDGEAVFVTNEQDSGRTIIIDTYKSVSWDEPIKVMFDNDSDETIELFWHNYVGARVSYGQLNPGQMLAMNTFVTHPWSATGNGDFKVDSAFVFEPQASDNGRTIVIRKI